MFLPGLSSQSPLLLPCWTLTFVFFLSLSPGAQERLRGNADLVSLGMIWGQLRWFGPFPSPLPRTFLPCSCVGSPGNPAQLERGSQSHVPFSSLTPAQLFLEHSVQLCSFLICEVRGSELMSGGIGISCVTPTPDQVTLSL